MNESMQLYDDSEYIREGVDLMQSGVCRICIHTKINWLTYANYFTWKQLECCGIDSKNDWCKFQNANETNCEIPNSCVLYNTGGYVDFFETGCLRRMNFIISQSAMLIATGATTVAFVQVSLIN